MIELPPLLAGALQLTSAWAVAGLAVTFCGAEGAATPAGVTALDCGGGRAVPVELLACTVNVYAVPGVSPVTVVLVALPLFTVTGAWAVEPMNGVTLYAVGAPPVLGAVQETVALELPAMPTRP